MIRVWESILLALTAVGVLAAIVLAVSAYLLLCFYGLAWLV